MPDEKYIEAFMKKTPKSKEAFDRIKLHVAGGVESNIRMIDPYPVYLTHGEGQYIFDIDGNKYYDLLCGLGAIIHGHNPPEIRQAVIDRVTKGGDALGAPTEMIETYAKNIKRAFPSMELLRFCNSGTEATMNLIRIARSYSGKDKIAKVEGSYHGGHDNVLHALHLTDDYLDSDPNNPPCLPYGSGIPKYITENMIKVIPFNNYEATAEILEKNADELGTVIMEPVMGGGGVIPPKDDYLKKVRKLTEKLGMVLIYDEVLVGFRIAFGGGQERYNVKADLTALSKIAGGGFQMACIGGKKEIMESILPKVQGTAAEVEAGMTSAVQVGTYNGHPTSLAAGNKSVELLTKPGTYEYLEKISKMLFGGLKDQLADKKMVGTVNNVGSLGCIYFDVEKADTWRSTLALNEEKWRKLFFGGLNKGIYFGIPHPDERFFLSLAMTEENIQDILKITDDLMNDIKKD